MPQVSRRPIDKNLEQRMYELLWGAIAKLDKKESVSEFLKDILTPTERVMIAKRLAMALLLARGWDQEAISRYLKVSTATVQTIKRVLATGALGYKKVILQIEKDENWGQMWLGLNQALEEILTERLTLRGKLQSTSKAGIFQRYREKREKYRLL